MAQNLLRFWTTFWFVTFFFFFFIVWSSYLLGYLLPTHHVFINFSVSFFFPFFRLLFGNAISVFGSYTKFHAFAWCMPFTFGCANFAYLPNVLTQRRIKYILYIHYSWFKSTDKYNLIYESVTLMVIPPLSHSTLMIIHNYILHFFWFAIVIHRFQFFYFFFFFWQLSSRHVIHATIKIINSHVNFRGDISIRSGRF